MKTALIIMFLILSIFVQNAISKPEKPQVIGGFTKCEVTEIRYKPAGSNKIESKTKINTIIYDENGNTIEVNDYDKGKISYTSKVKNKYNDKKLVIESEYYDKDGKIFLKNTYEYDKNLNKIASHTFNQKNEESSSVKYIYDKNDFLTKEIYYNRENKKDVFTNSNTLKNDKFGNRIEEINEQISGSKSTVTYEYKYDSKNNIIREVRTSFDNYKFIREYKYDEFGNMIETHYFDDNGKLAMIVKYEYSKK